MSDTGKSSSPWRNGFFLLFVTAAFVSNVGTWLFNVAAGWLMTELDGSALMVSLVQTANLLPLVLLAVPAGTLGDLADRRRILLWGQSILIGVNAVFAYLVMVEAATPQLLLLFTLLNGAGAAVCAPLMTAVIPQLVSREQLSTAMSIGGISFNAARAIGPILCGYLITTVSMALPFWIDAVSFAAVVLVIFFWSDDRDRVKDQLPVRVFQLAMGDSLRFLRYTPALYNSVLRAILFFVGAGALWALLPLVAREQLQGDANLYGYLVGTVGIGAVIVGVFYDRIVSIAGGGDRLTLIVSMAFAVALAGLGSVGTVYWAYLAAVLCGACWQLAFTSLITSTQYALPTWFGVRGMAYYFMAMGLSLALGSALWGWLADAFSLQWAHYVAAATCAATALLGLRFPLDQAKGADLRAFTRYPEVHIPAADDEDPGGLLLVQNSYQPGQADISELAERLLKLRNKRYRSGALRWHLFKPLEGEDRVVESFAEIKYTVAHRHDSRITQADQNALQDFEDWLKSKGGSCEQQLLEEVYEVKK